MNPLQKFQQRIGVNPDGQFGKNTLRKAVEHLKLTKEQGAHFFAQISHETGEFKLYEENLNYSAQGLVKIFGKYFNSVTAKLYARQPEKIANKVYANRMGNGNELSGDGWKFRGRGFLQLTGRSNYELFAQYVKDGEVLKNPDLVTEKYAMESALFYFDRNKLWDRCKKVDDDTILLITKKINGGTNGLAHRKELTNKYYILLK